MPEAFVGPPAVGSPMYGMGSTSPVGGQRRPDLASIAAYGAEQYVQNPDFRNKVNSGVKSAYGKAKQMMGSRGPKSGSSNNNNGRPRRPRGGSSGGDSFDFTPSGIGRSGLFDTPNPRRVELKSPIVPNLYVDRTMDAMEDKCSCLHFVCCNILMPVTGDPLFDYINNNVIPHFQQKAQEVVSFNLNTATDFSVANIRSYLFKVIQAYQIYYYYKSIYVYYSDPKNQNGGMLFLKAQITADMVEQLEDLGRKLSDLPFPPKMGDLIRYLSSNFYSGDNQGSALLKIYPSNGSTSMVSASDISTVYSNLNTTSDNRTASLLAKALPSWIPGKMSDPPAQPVYDPNFITIHANAPFMTSAEGETIVRCGPFASDDGVDIIYNSYTNNLDGLAYAMTSINVGTEASPIWNPGILKPVTNLSLTAGYTRWSYYEVAGNKQFYPSDTIRFLSRSRFDTYYMIDEDGPFSSTKANSTAVQGVSAATVRNTVKNALYYLMEL